MSWMDHSMGLHRRTVKVGLIEKYQFIYVAQWKFLFIPSRFINSRVPIPLCWCCSYHSDCIVAAGIRDIPTLQAPTGVPAGLGQLAGDSTVSILHNIHICICHPLSVCLQLAVANWSGSCFSGMGWTNNLSPEMAHDGSIRSDVCEHPVFISEDSFPGPVAGDCLCSGILHALVWTRWDGKWHHTWAFRLVLIVYPAFIWSLDILYPTCK